jgi:hypothetical protein
MNVYMVQHTHVHEDGREDVKILGVYSSEPLAQAAVRRAHALPGFRDLPNGFEVVKIRVDRDEWSEGFKTE